MGRGRRAQRRAPASPARRERDQPVERADVLEALRSAGGRPVPLKELHERLGVAGGLRRSLLELLGELKRARAIEEVGHKRYRAGGPRLLTGRLVGSRSGDGFVVADQGGPDIYVGRLREGGPRHGDRVAVALQREDRGRRSGRIQSVVEAGSDTFVGLYQATSRGGLVAPRDERLGAALPALDSTGARDGELVLARLAGSGEARQARILEVLGDPLDPDTSVRAALRGRGFDQEFPAPALAAARALGLEITPAARRGRTDFRRQPVVTIDGDDAKDFDDAVALEQLSGGWRLTVHIADVSHYVSENGELDRAAHARSTSIYFPERAVPMLPPELSEELCSLKPGVERLVQSAVMTLDKAGTLRGIEFHDGVIRSAARLTYTLVARALDGQADARAQLGAHWSMIQDLAQLAARLRQRRERRGALDFDFPEAKVQLDPHGRLLAVVKAERTEAHRLIEEFMLLANEAVAAYLLEQQIPALYRIHQPPDRSKLEELDRVARRFGQRLPAAGALRPRDLQRFLKGIEGRPEGPLLHQLTLQALMQARYSAEPEAHFGLAAKIYTHFTSPIRRYPDLVVHRILRRLRHGQLGAAQRQAWSESLPALAAHSSERERSAAEAEYEVLAARRAALMRERLGQTFDGRITGIKGFGMFVELDSPFADGLLPLEALPRDSYVFDEQAYELRGVTSGQVYRLGQPIQVVVERVDPLRSRVTFGIPVSE